jgi:UDP-N-acetylglucosamine acyltransferase
MRFSCQFSRDCRIGSGVIFSNGVLLAGHCIVGDYAIIGGGSAVHQFARIGEHAFIGAMTGIGSDVIPYGMAITAQRAAHLSGLNIIGLKRRGFTREQIHELRRAYRLLFANEGTLKERVEDVAGEFEEHPLIHEILDFIREGGERAICVPHESE